MAPWELSGSAVLAAAVFVGGTASSPLVAPGECPGGPGRREAASLRADQHFAILLAHPVYLAIHLFTYFLAGLFEIKLQTLLHFSLTTSIMSLVTECNPLSAPPSLSELNDSVNENSDTVGQIVQYIMKNEANVDVLKAMVADNSLGDPESPVTPSTPGSPPVSPGPLSPGGTPGKHICGHHLHTVGGAVERDVCHRCRHKRWHFIRPTNKSKQGHARRQGEVTVLSVGRFRVTKVEHKSNQKERRSLMSVSGTDSVNGDVPATPVKREQSDTE
uniref:RELT like 1 n=1 Tax=Canis lupus familiaris TaxID=9615 RepID=A0A8I3MWZ0_CANLF